MSPAFYPRRLLVCAFAVLLVIATMPSPAVAGRSVQEVPVGFEENVYTEQRGDVAEISIRFRDVDTATVRIGANATHAATVAVRDEDGDGEATVRLNIYDGSVGASAGDGVTVLDRSNVSTPLETGRYDLDLWEGAGTDGERWGVGTLAIRERSTDSIRTFVAPESAELGNRSAIRSAKESGNFTRSTFVSETDTLVLELRASGLEGAVATRNGSNVTDRFFAAFDGSLGTVTVRHLHPGPEQREAVLDVRNHTSTTVIHDPANDSYFLVVNLSRASMDAERGDDLYYSELRTGGYRANATLPASFDSTEQTESVTTEFTIEYPDADVELASGSTRLVVAPTPNQTVEGRTTLVPGNRVTVRLYDDVGNLVAERTVRVENGTEGENRFAAQFDFSQFDDGSKFTVTIRGPDESMLLGSRSGQKGRTVVVGTPRASVRVVERGLTERGVVVEHATLSNGGYVAIHHNSTDGAVLGRSEYVAPGEEFDRFVELDAPLDRNATLVAVAHHTGSGDSLGEPYTENGTVVSDSVEYGTERTTDSTTETTVSVTTDTIRTSDPVPTSTTVTDPTKEPPERPPSVPIPGFGVAAAVVALLGAILLARRRI